MPSGHNKKTLWTPAQTGLVASNYVSAYQRAPAESKRLGKQFYPNWNEDAQHIGGVVGKSMAHGAAILAHLSPSNEAELNRMHALQLVHGMDDRAYRSMGKASEAAGRAKSSEVKLRNAVKNEDFSAANVHQADYDRASAENKYHRGKAKLTGTPLSSQGSTFIYKAMQVAHGVHDADPLGSLGNVKIGDFGRLIHDPKYERAPIDTHYHDAGMNRTDIPYKAERGLSSVGRYESFQNAHQIARGEVSSMIGRKISTADMMGGVWYAHQQRKVAENPDAMKARKASDTKLGNIRASKGAQPFLPENFGLRPSLGKIKVS